MRLLATLFLLTSLPAIAADISQLNWLSGCWAYDGKDAGSGEYWMSAAGRTMFAVSRSVRDGETVGFEYLHIKETETSSLLLIASPSGQTPSEFNMLSLSDTEVVFENPEHDFPQRIIYRLGDKDTLLGRIEGKLDGEEIAVDFPMTRTSCADPGL
jgi:hypothetical protein